jgi:hypothetical protein
MKDSDNLYDAKKVVMIMFIFFSFIFALSIYIVVSYKPSGKSFEAKIGGSIYDKPFGESTIPEKILRLDSETERQLPRYKSLLTRLTGMFPETNESQIVNMTAPIWQKCRDLKKDISYYDILTAMSHTELDNHGNACKGYADALTDWTLQYLHLE